jgi:LAGLIDADG endonuclease
MDTTVLAYIAGFLDGDGSIFFQLVRRKDYCLGYQVRTSIAFYQKTENERILLWLKEQFLIWVYSTPEDGNQRLYDRSARGSSKSSHAFATVRAPQVGARKVGLADLG